MKIAFDQQVFLLQQYGGISRYFCSLVSRLADLPGIEAEVFAPLHFNFGLESVGPSPGTRHRLPEVNTKIFRAVSAVSKYWARAQINHFKPDILHETYFSSDSYLPRGAKRVLTVYDMIFERFADGQKGPNQTAEAKRVAVQRADHIICISESTQRDLIEFLSVPEEKTSVVYLSVDDEFKQVDDGAEIPAQVKKPYLLFVGSRGGYKNFLPFLDSFSRSSDLRKNFSIVCFGGGAVNVEEQTAMSALHLNGGQISQVSGDDRKLADYYRNAACLVYPSLYEGFGIPPLEAMACACPVICSHTSSLPEVVGDAGVYVDPTNIDAMTHAIERVVTDSSGRDELIAKGKAQVEKFSWRRCAVETAEIYRGLL